MVTAVSSPAERCIVLQNIPWAVYDAILAVHQDRSVPRFTYDQGQLEIMSPSSEHEELKHMVALFVEVLAEEWGLNIRGFGSTTFRREDLQRGFEPDACFYVQNAERIRGTTELDLTTDPPPDVVIEIDLTSPSLPKFPLFAQLGVPEVWRYNGQRWHISYLDGGAYTVQTQSAALPGLTADALTALLDDSLTLERLPWLRQVRTWAREQPPGGAATPGATSS